MKLFIEEYGKYVLQILVAVSILGILLFTFLGYWQSNTVENVSVMTDHSLYAGAKKPSLVATAKTVKTCPRIDLMEGVTASDVRTGDISNRVTVKGIKGSESRVYKEGGKYYLTCDSPGLVHLRYEVKNWCEVKTTKDVIVVINR